MSLSIRRSLTYVSPPWRSHCRDLDMDFEIPFRELGFSGVPHRSTAFIMPTVRTASHLMRSGRTKHHLVLAIPIWQTLVSSAIHTAHQKASHVGSLPPHLTPFSSWLPQLSCSHTYSALVTRPEWSRSSIVLLWSLLARMLKWLAPCR